MDAENNTGLKRHGAWSGPSGEERAQDERTADQVPDDPGSLLPGMTRRGLACRNCAARQECGEHARRFLQGYVVRGAGRALLPSWRRTHLALSVGTALCDTLGIQLLLASHILLVLNGAFWLSALAFVPALILVARCLRGLEVLVHEGSHYNWTRKRRTNDRLVNLAAAYAVFQTVETFRVGHALHHKELGGTHDPCRQRFFDLGWAELRRTSAVAFARGVAGRLGRYSASWWRLIGSDGNVILWGIGWHVVVFILPLTLFFAKVAGMPAGLAGMYALLTWFVYVGGGFFVVLPPLRFIAEAAKHDYVRGTTTKSGTFSNIGPVHWLLHPHGDGYHFLHHVDANIPHHRLRAVHRWLTMKDPEYASNRHRHRILQEVPLYSATNGRSNERTTGAA